MEWKNISMHLYRHTWILLPVSQADRTEIRQGMSVHPVWLERLNPSPCHFVIHPCVGYSTGRPLVGKYGHEEAHTTLLLQTVEPSVSWPLHFFSKAEDMRRSHDFAYRNKNGDNSRKKGTDSSVNCAGCTLDGLSFWLSSCTQPLSTAHQPGTALHKRHSTASRPELTLLSAPLEHQRGDFAHNLIWIHLEDVTYYSGKCWIVLVPEKALF